MEKRCSLFLFPKRTLSGKEVRFSRDPTSGRVSANGVGLVEESGTSVPDGDVLFVDGLLFVDRDRVRLSA